MLGIFNQEIFSEENIHSLYKQKKLNLKKHYEKIKTAIKESIDKDLEQLEKREKQQLTMIDTKRKQLAFDAQKLSRIKTDAINLENQGKDIAAVEEKLAEITKKNKTEAGKITDWKATVANAGSEDFLSSISRATDEQFSCHLKFTLESLQKGKDYLYEPEMYMMIQSKGANKDPSYFSFEKKRTSTG